MTKKLINILAKKIFDKIGVSIVRSGSSIAHKFPPDFDKKNIEICKAVANYTMTTPERVNILVDAVKYITSKNIEGDMVECGVWKGGSSMAIALALIELKELSRDIYLYDTYSGMSAPTSLDVSVHGEKAAIRYAQSSEKDENHEWCFSSIDEVKHNVIGTNYPANNLYFIEGKVEDTIPDTIPEKIALLRLDTDWYESTKHELDHLFPRLQTGGVIIIDDYGYWGGARKAVDEYFERNNCQIFLLRIDGSARIAVKQG